MRQLTVCSQVFLSGPYGLPPWSPRSFSHVFVLNLCPWCYWSPSLVFFTGLSGLPSRSPRSPLLVSPAPGAAVGRGRGRGLFQWWSMNRIVSSSTTEAPSTAHPSLLAKQLRRMIIGEAKTRIKPNLEAFELKTCRSEPGQVGLGRV